MLQGKPVGTAKEDDVTIDNVLVKVIIGKVPGG